MDLSSNVAKIIGGVGAASVTAVATGIGIDQNNKNKEHQKKLDEENRRILAQKEKERVIKENFQKAVNGIKESTVGQTNWFEGGLYEFLDDQDIVFKLFKGSSGSEELTKDNFQLNKNQDLLIRVEVLISDNSGQLKTSSSGKVKIEHLKALKENNDWTWSCNVKFSTIGVVDESGWPKKLADENKFFNNQQNGFFNVLTKDLTEENEESNRNKWKNIKKGFVKNCSDFGKSGKSQTELKSSLPYFVLRKKTDNSDDKLYFFNMQTALNPKTWFDENITWLDGASVIGDSTAEMKE